MDLFPRVRHLPPNDVLSAHVLSERTSLHSVSRAEGSGSVLRWDRASIPLDSRMAFFGERTVRMSQRVPQWDTTAVPVRFRTPTAESPVPWIAVPGIR